MTYLTKHLTGRFKRLAASTTASGMLLVAAPVALDYVVRPGDTLSHIAERHDTSVSRLVEHNDLHPSGDQVVAGQTLSIPPAHGRGGVRGTGPTATSDPDARKVVGYTVRPGDTPSGLAVRFHAWTAELVARNDLAGTTLQVGQRIEIPVVLAAVTRDRAGPSRARVREIIEATARRYGVDPQLALAVSWQEAGWQQHHVSHASAIGAMQVIPSTGEWMSSILGRRLDLRDVRDNVTAGVVLLRELNQAATPRRAIAGYYQGLASVRSRGMYDDTVRYVANVLALKHRFEQGDYPA